MDPENTRLLTGMSLVLRRLIAQRVYPQVVGKGARRSRRFDVARSRALAESPKSLGLLTPRRPEGRAPGSRQFADALWRSGQGLFVWPANLLEFSLQAVPGRRHAKA